MDHIIQVYILASQEDNENVKHLLQSFSDPYFQTRVLTNPLTWYDANRCHFDNHRRDKERTNNNNEADCYLLDMMMGCLKNNADRDRYSPLLLVREELTTSLSPETMAEAVGTAIRTGDYDFYLLHRWGDSCNRHEDKQKLDGLGIGIATVNKIEGFYAILLTPQGRDRILGREKLRTGDTCDCYSQPFFQLIQQEVDRGALKGAVLYPNILSYDLSLAITSNDYRYGCDCSLTEEIAEILPTAQGFSVWWFVLIIIIGILVCWWLAKRDSH